MIYVKSYIYFILKKDETITLPQKWCQTILTKGNHPEYSKLKLSPIIQNKPITI